MKETEKQSSRYCKVTVTLNRACSFVLAESYWPSTGGQGPLGIRAGPIRSRAQAEAPGESGRRKWGEDQSHTTSATKLLQYPGCK